jgi:hypothetical protein
VVESQIAALASEQTDRGLVMTLGDVLFDTGSADLKNSASRTVLKLVQFLQLNPRRVVRIEGYTDSTGLAEDNLKLSRDRAQSVADMLVDLGIDEKRLQVEGYGDQYPIEANASERGRAQNRRVEIVFSDDKGSSRQRAESCQKGSPCGPAFCRPDRFASYHAVVLSTMLQSVPVHFATVTVSSTVSAP